MCTWNFHARRVNLPELAGLALKIYVAHWPGLLEAWLVLTSFKYHGNLYILIPLNQRLALTRLRATGPWKRLQRKCEWRLKFDLELKQLWRHCRVIFFAIAKKLYHTCISLCSVNLCVYLFIYLFIYNNFICNNQYKKAAIREELNPHVRWPHKNIYKAIKEI